MWEGERGGKLPGLVGGRIERGPGRLSALREETFNHSCPFLVSLPHALAQSPHLHSQLLRRQWAMHRGEGILLLGP